MPPRGKGRADGRRVWYGTATMAVVREDGNGGGDPGGGRKTPAGAGRAAAEGALAFLRRAPLFRGIPESFLAELADAVDERRLAAGQVVLRQGEHVPSFYLVGGGRMEVVLEQPGEGPVHLTYLHPGDYFGDMSLLTGEPSYATVQAAEEALLYVMPPAAFNLLLRRHPRVYHDFVRALYERLHLLHVGISEARSKAHLVSQLLADERGGDHAVLLGLSRAARDLREAVRRHAAGDWPVLLTGEKGVGKELVARLIHQESGRRGAPFLVLNCAQVAEDTWGNQIFGSRTAPPGLPEARIPGLVDVADGGTLLLKDVDLLPMGAQGRLARYLAGGDPGAEAAAGPAGGPRIMATARVDLEAAAAAGRFHSGLYDLLRRHRVVVPPLRERKRDIPALAAYFIQRHARRLGKAMDARLAPHDLERLLAFDYAAENVQELEDVIERAVTLADGPRVRSEHLLLGRRWEAAGGYDLLRWPWLRRLVLRGALPGWVAAAGTAGFLAALGWLFFGPQDPTRNPVLGLAWSLWWPGLWVATFFLARSWCAICPFQTLGRLAQRIRHLNLPVPAFVQRRYPAIVTGGFLLIIWTEEITGMREKPWATGLLVLAITLGAVVFHVLLRRQAWCRYLCPLGAMVGVAAMGSVLELRAKPDVCETCNTHECYRGSARVPGCPQFLHLPFVESNQNCTLCLNCVRSCPNESPRLNVRFPGRELWRLTRVSPEMVYLVAALQGVLVPVIAYQRGLLSPAAFTLFYVGTAVVFAGAVKALHVLARRSGSFDEAQALKQAWYAHLPLALGGHTAYQLAHLPVVGALAVQVVLTGAPPGGAAPVAGGSLLGMAQWAVLMGGLLLAVYAIWRVSRRPELGRWRALRPLWWAHAAVVAAYAAALVLVLRAG